MKENNNVYDYSTYHFTKSEYLSHIFLGSIYYFALGMIFFKYLPIAILAVGLTPIYMKSRRNEAIAKRKRELLESFREGVYTLSSSLSAGKSVELAFIASLKDLKLIYSEEADIIREWRLIVHKIAINETVTSAMLDFASRADIEDINNFTSVFVIGKEYGGNLTEIIRNTIKLINEKSEIQKDIDILVTQKQYEQKILSLIIPGMILFFWLTSGDFLEPLYTTLAGRVVMLVALALYSISGIIGKKIVKIEV